MRKMFTLLAASLLVVSAACSSGSSKAPGDSAAAPSGDQPVTITIVDKDLQPDDKFLKGIEEGMKAEGKNVKLQLVPVQSGTYSEKLGLLLQSGNIPDLIYFQGGDYQFAVTQKILEDLTPYIEKSTHVKASMNPYNQERTKNYPYLVWLSPTSSSVPVVRQDWFDKTASGKELLVNPTVDNYYTFFKELKEKNGTKFAYTTAGTLDELDAMFGQAFGLTSTWLKGEDGKYAFGKTTSFEKDKLEFYAKLYKDGLLDPEFLTKKWDTKEKAFYDGQAAVIAGTQGKVIDLYNTKSTSQNGAAAKVMPLPPAKGKGQGYTPVDVSKESRGFAIAKTAKNKEMAFAVLEYLASPKGQLLDKLGIEGEQYTVVDNKIKLTAKSAEWYPRFVESTVNFKPEFDPSTPYLSESAAKSLEMMSKLSKKDNSFIIPAELSAKWDACNALYKEFAANVVMGKKTIVDFDQFVQAWNAAGGKEMTDYANQTIK
ncbi:putative aldouronate transport system substrate-binding protein [Paenibacillus tianmuensis]|uniref:Putative aldouronate transport system substrate-binding protein n=1 Tax=Paenibacillus tianmuensis TaxID=624147 RepID=A0A1G4SNJ2_9BACL|nr:extracellular solute-binding protein [Paenibacillus tianmuensis]SCW70804.1 putative aldouronate transport system substrate-binding protein [Paenibacillus tianmuensis]